jgi:nucleotide-binding universal stress UspA family protein
MNAQQAEQETTAVGAEDLSVRELQEKLAEQAVIGQQFGTFSGVFTPTLLTILGVIMYLREGWVVGNAGLLGAWLIILIARTITACTGLAMSSITTNIRIGAGGAFSIISQSLGLEVGGSVGIPLYLAQALAVAMYIFGFREGWRWVFPEHPALLVDLATYAVLFAIAAISANFAFRIQYLIMVIIAGSLVSVLIAAFQGSMQHPVTWWGKFPGAPEDGFSGVGFWRVFAVFFPAATGIMAGVNMSGELKTPRRSIPIGTITAIALSTVIYLVLAYWLARSATAEELISNYTIMIDRAAWGPIVLAGLLGATFSSALASLVGAPRILHALGEHRILPGGNWFAQRTPAGEPRPLEEHLGRFFTGQYLLPFQRENRPEDETRFERIVVPLDGTHFAEHALPLAKVICHTYNSHLTLVAVTPKGKAEDAAGEERNRTGYLQHIAWQLHRAQIQAETRLRSGAVAEEIHALAQEAQAELIIMSTHALPGLDRLYTGDVANKLIRILRLPLLLLRPTEQWQSRGTQFKKIARQPGRLRSCGTGAALCQSVGAQLRQRNSAALGARSGFRNGPYSRVPGERRPGAAGARLSGQSHGHRLRPGAHHSGAERGGRSGSDHARHARARRRGACDSRRQRG